MPQFTIAVLTGLTLTLMLAMPASAGGKRNNHASAKPHPAERDCTPINGRYGYYGNPFCDTGSYRLEDIEFRQRQAAYRRWKTGQGQ